MRRSIVATILFASFAYGDANEFQQLVEEHHATHWAFLPPRERVIDRSNWPTTLQSWPRTKLDGYVLDQLVDHAMTPSPEADRLTLIRRLAYDLWGLPPALEMVDAFVADRSPNAYEELVDQMLASPRYGERWGRHWLDVARYADTRGYTFAGADRNYHFAYTYRDYVIRSINQDLPYDRFITEQLAADQIELGDDNRALAGLGFLTVGRKYNNVHDDIDEQIDTVTRGLLGLTVACARCHDHKFDAIPIEDYYSLYGVFRSSHEPQRFPLIGDGSTRRRNEAYENEFDAARQALDQFDNRMAADLTSHVRIEVGSYLQAVACDEAIPGLRTEIVKDWKQLLSKRARPDEATLMPWHALLSVSEEEIPERAAMLAQSIAGPDGKFLNPMVREQFIESPPKNRAEVAARYATLFSGALQQWDAKGGTDQARSTLSSELRQLLWYFSDPKSPGFIRRDQLHRYLSNDEKAARDRHEATFTDVKERQPADFHRAMTMVDRDRPVEPHVFERGDAASKGDRVSRQGPAVATVDRQTYSPDHSGRRELADEIAHRDNRLTARVQVNRVWTHHFGKPLTADDGDFGVQCPRPTHLALLDHLAIYLMDHDWSLKALHRHIVLSATYRQASGDRPDCYGVDPDNQLLWRMNRRRLDFEALYDSLLAAADRLDYTVGGRSVRMFGRGQSGFRRAVYGYIDRQDLPNLLRVFDFAGPDQSASRRAETTIPQQALFMLNSEFVRTQAGHVATRLSDVSDDKYVDALYRIVLLRHPTSEEVSVASSILRDGAIDSFQARRSLAQLLLMTNAYCHVD